MLILIAAVSSNNVIGLDNKLPWKISEDLEYFKKITMGHSIVMGRKTYESINKPLPGRKNIILSRNFELNIEGCFVIHNLNKIIALSKLEDIFVIGGEEIYNLFINKADKILITKIKINLKGDSFFPKFSLNFFKLSKKTPQKDFKSKYTYNFLEFSRKT